MKSPRRNDRRKNTTRQTRIDERARIMELLAKGAAHDFQNLLIPVATILEISKPNLRGPEKQLHAIATDNLSFVRGWLAEAINVGTLQPRRQKTSTKTLVMAACANVRDLADAKQIKIGATIASFRIAVDIALCTMAIAQLLKNAIEASSAGTEVTVDVSRTSPNVMTVRVVDSGAGVPEPHRNHLGRPFFTTKKSLIGSRGFGLGLARCQQVALLHGGELRHKNIRSGGAAFAFSICCG